MTQNAQHCSICKKPAQTSFTPFCSKRCADVDLHRWLKGSYAIPGRDGEAKVPASDADDDLEF